MSAYAYTAGRPVRGASVSEHGRALSPESNGYTDNSFDQHDQSLESNTMFYDPTSPFFGMDPQLVGFVQKHNVVMGDGAVLNINAIKEKAAWEGKRKKQYNPPCGLTICQFTSMVILLLLGSAVLVTALVVGLVFGLRLNRPSYSHAQPWWRRTQMYQIQVATWANDVEGPTGRLADLIPRMAYLSTQVGATSIILTDLLANDVNGITNWTLVDNKVAAPDEAIQSLIPKLVSKANRPLGALQRATPITIILGIPIYGTSIRHTWFEQSRLATLSPFASFYLWTSTPPATPQEQRHYAYDRLRNAYYRHVHGNPNTPLLNLTNPEVQLQMKNVLQYWKTQLKIQGVMITNSTNVPPEMAASLRSLLDSAGDDQFMWFADQPQADALLNTGNKVCFFDININRRVPTRANDLTAQITQAMNDTRLSTCSPIWRVVQLSQEDKDYRTVQQIAHFLPGSFLMVAGQEVDLSTGSTELIRWSYKRFNDFSTYWPRNINLELDGLARLREWRAYWTAAARVSLLDTDVNIGRLMIIQPRLVENIFAGYRVHRDNRDRVYFVVSFQTLNTVVQFSSIFFNLNSPVVEVSYDTKDTYQGRRRFGETTMVNNQVLLLYYY